MAEHAKRVAVVGGGIAGLTASLRLAEAGYSVDLYESAPVLGGRAKSHYDEDLAVWVDNGPHLVVGAYAATRSLLADIGAGHHISWQKSLTLPLWEKHRGYFALQAPSWLPISLALLFGVARLPGHGWSSVKTMLKVAMTMANRDEEQTVAQWLEEIGAPDLLVQDMLEVLCLGVMNEPLDSANARTFARVLATSFASHQRAKMGWFNKPLTQALIEPLQAKLERLGVHIHLKHTVRELSQLDHDAVLLALPAFARNRLLGVEESIATQAITNVHLWFEQPLPLPAMMVGMLGTYSQWLFDVNKMISHQGLYHYSVTVSADGSAMNQEECLQQVLLELEQVVNQRCHPVKSRVVKEKRATVLVRRHSDVKLPQHVFDASESPQPGDLPATIELAVLTAEKTVAAIEKLYKINA